LIKKTDIVEVLSIQFQKKVKFSTFGIATNILESEEVYTKHAQCTIIYQHKLYTLLILIQIDMLVKYLIDVLNNSSDWLPVFQDNSAKFKLAVDFLFPQVNNRLKMIS